MDFISWVQTRLIAHGFDPGLVDGVWGRNTLAAVVAFQRSRSLPAEGSLNEATVAALRKAPDGGASDSDRPSKDILNLFPWMDLALRKKGLHENRDNRDLRAFLNSDGSTLGDPAKKPWCGDFVETCIAVTLPTEVLPTNPYLARNWLKFGKTVDPACFGSVLVFWRISRSGSAGHVGFYYSEDARNYHVLGGNQSDSINISAISKNRFLGARFPNSGGPYPRKQIRSASDWKLSENEA